MKKRIYIAGPITHGDSFINVRTALDAAEKIHNMGFSIHLPHLHYSWHMTYPKKYDDWIAIDNDNLERCDALFRIPGYSPGSDNEELLALKLGKPIFRTYEELERYLKV